MRLVETEIKILKEGHLPHYEHLTDSGADCFASLDKTVILKAGGYEKIPLGFALGLPKNYEVQIRPRSGLAARNGIFCHFGTVDQEYTGEVCVIMFNHSDTDIEIKDGMKVCQMVISPVWRADFNVVNELEETERGANGFGSSGV